MQMQLKNVKITPVPGGWQIGGKPAKDHVINLPVNSGSHLISFQITGGGSDIKFDETQPIWISAGSKPSKWAKDAQIEWRIAKQGRELSVIDWNDNHNPDGTQPLVLHYRLRFDGHDDLDPIINNGGTTTPPVSPPPPRADENAPAGATAGTSSAAGRAADGPQVAGVDLIPLLVGLILGTIIGYVLCRLRKAKD